MPAFKVQPLPTEKRPKPKPVDRITALAPGVIAHKVGGNDDWYSLASQFGHDAYTLMDFNFKTIDSGEINWYLREYVGCRVSDERGMNWKFRNADPGIIYIPPRSYNMYDLHDSADRTTIIEGTRPWTKEWGASLAGAPPGGPHVKVLVIEIVHLVIAALEMAALHALEHSLLFSLGVVAAPFAAEAAVLAAIGGAHMDGFRIRAKREMKDGYAMGAVLAANGARPSFVDNHYQQRSYPDKKLQNVYNIALKAGYLDGKKLNLPQRDKLFRMLHARMPQELMPKGKWSDLSDIQKRKYYNAAAMAFNILFVKN